MAHALLLPPQALLRLDEVLGARVLLDPLGGFAAVVRGGALEASDDTPSLYQPAAVAPENAPDAAVADQAVDELSSEEEPAETPVEETPAAEDPAPAADEPEAEPEAEAETEAEAEAETPAEDEPKKTD